MSATAPSSPVATGGPPQDPAAAAEACPLCGGPLAGDQEWCLRCGAAARTRLAAAPNWKGPIATLAVVAALALGVLAAALVKLAGDSGPAPAPTTRTVTTVPAAAPTPTPTPTTGTPATTLPGTSTPGASTPTTPAQTTTQGSTGTPTTSNGGATTPTTKPGKGLLRSLAPKK